MSVIATAGKSSFRGPAGTKNAVDGLPTSVARYEVKDRATAAMASVYSRVRLHATIQAGSSPNTRLTYV